MKHYTLHELSRFIDHTNLKADVTEAAIYQLCDEAKSYQFKMVAINQSQSKRCADYLAGSDIGIGAAIAFPLGQTSIKAKVEETGDAIIMGATEIDYVINITEVKAGNFSYIEDEMRQIVNVCRANQVISKVIFENCYLTKKEIVQLCQLASLVRPDFIKTSTGFGASGATIEDVKLMKESVSNKVKVKAAGGIRDAGLFKAMIAAGAERIGTSAGITIMTELQEQLAGDENSYFII